MFSYIQSSKDSILDNPRCYILDDTKFIRNRKLILDDYINILCYNNGSTNTEMLDYYLEENNFIPFDDVSKQTFSKQRTWVSPELFKQLSRNYLEIISYTRANSFFKTYKGYRILAGDGSDFELPNCPSVRETYGIIDTPKYTKPVNAKFCAIMDVMNGFILDGILGKYKQGELPLMHQVLDNISDILLKIPYILTFDRGFNAMELYAHILELNGNFVIRLKKSNYKHEREVISISDSPIKLELNDDRIKRFKIPELLVKYSKETGMELRIVTIKLKNGDTETLLTNIPANIMSGEEIGEIYKMRWGIETNFNTMKNRLEIENYSGKRKITIEQDIYAKFFKYNIFQYAENYMTLLINLHKRRKGITTEYQANQSILIRKLNKYVMRMLINPSKSNVRHNIKRLIRKAKKEPTKVDVEKHPSKRNTSRNRKYNLNYKRC